MELEELAKALNILNLPSAKGRQFVPSMKGKAIHLEVTGEVDTSMTTRGVQQTQHIINEFTRDLKTHGLLPYDAENQVALLHDHGKNYVIILSQSLDEEIVGDILNGKITPKKSFAEKDPSEKTRSANILKEITSIKKTIGDDPVLKLAAVSALLGAERKHLRIDLAQLLTSVENSPDHLARMKDFEKSPKER